MRGTCCIVVALLCLPLPATGGKLSDAGKKRRILELYRGYKKELGSFPEVTVPKLLELRRKRDVVLVDAREEREREVSVIKGAVPARVFLGRLRRHPEKRPVVVYCTIGYRSAQLVKKLRKRGIDARNLVGSILLWTHYKQPLYHEGKATRRLHVYGKTWDLAPGGIQTVY